MYFLSYCSVYSGSRLIYISAINNVTQINAKMMFFQVSCIIAHAHQADLEIDSIEYSIAEFPNRLF